MKIRLSAVLLLTLVGMAAMMWAATLTVDIPGSPADPNSDVSRVSRAYGQLYQLGHNASMPEVALQTQLWIISQTKGAERQGYNNNFVETPMTMQPTPTPTPSTTPTPAPTPTP
jgi:hypothetical protein